jgi:hypothetical protein
LLKPSIQEVLSSFTILKETYKIRPFQFCPKNHENIGEAIGSIGFLIHACLPNQ